MKPTFPLSMINVLGDPLRKRILPIDSERAMKLAERLTGLHDYDDPDGTMRKNLDATIESVLSVDWNTLGRFGIRYILNWHLSNRLRLVELLKQRPEIGDIAIERPLIITGLFRTGTTYLHNVLAADTASRTGRMWELAHPVGRARDLFGDEKWRRWRGSHEVAMDDVMIPEQGEAHKVTVDAFEEDFFLIENDLVVMKLFVGMGAYDYGRRTLDWEMRGSYEWHRRQLQILWAHRSAGRWLLKCPWHLWNLHDLLAVYPDACVIQTHRELVDSIGSQCSLSARIASKFQRELDLHEVGRFWLDYSRMGIVRGLRARAGLPKSQIYDVRLEDLKKNPLRMIESIYGHFDLPFDEALAARLRQRIAEEPTAQLGEHDYDIADYGLSRDQIEDVFVEYREAFGV